MIVTGFTRHVLASIRARRTETVRYVAHYKIPEFKAMGWVVTDDLASSPQGRYSVIMEKRG